MGSTAGRSRGRGLLDPLLDAGARRILLTTVGLFGVLAATMALATMMLAASGLEAEVDRAVREATARARSEVAAGQMPDRGVDRITDLGHHSSDPQSGVFVLALRPDGSLIGQPAPLPGLPDDAAIAAAGSGDDLRRAEPGGVGVKLMTVKLDPPLIADGEEVGYLQVGLITTMEEQERRNLFLSLVVVALLGLLGTALLGWAVTRRAMQPVRVALEHERRFLADASHQLRTPLAVLRSSAEVLKLEGRVGPKGQPLVDDVIDEADRLARIVDDLHALAVLQAAPRPPEERVDVAAVAREASDRARALGRVRQVEVVFDAAPGCGGEQPVLGSRRALDELLMILLENAIRYSPDRGTVRLGVARLGPQVELTVDDEGRGIAESDRERIFEPFARVAEAPSGSGLGLAIAAQIVAAHGGRIEALEAPGGGARLRVALPLVARLDT